MAVTRCGHTNMYYYHGMEAYTGTGFTSLEWKKHHNPIVVLRNPLDRVRSATSYASQDMVLLTTVLYEDVIVHLRQDEWKNSKIFMSMIDQGQENCKQSMQALYNHSYPYMKSILVDVNFRVIDFYDLDKYVPRRDDLFQSRRTDSYVGESTVEHIYVKDVGYSIEELQEEFDLYNKFMVTRERVSPEEWKELTRGT